MKTISKTVPLDVTVRMKKENVSGSSCQAVLPKGTKRSDVVRVFGQPQYGESMDGKVKEEWVGTINGNLFTLYRYKDSDVYSVGGFFALTGLHVVQFFNEMSKPKKDSKYKKLVQQSAQSLFDSLVENLGDAVGENFDEYLGEMAGDYDQLQQIEADVREALIDLLGGK